jgi:hypothetical protein
LPDDQEAIIEKLWTAIGEDVDATFANVIGPRIDWMFRNAKKTFSKDEYWDVRAGPLADFAVNELHWEEDYGFARRTVGSKLVDLSLFLGQVKRRKWSPR